MPRQTGHGRTEGLAMLGIPKKLDGCLEVGYQKRSPNRIPPEAIRADSAMDALVECRNHTLLCRPLLIRAFLNLLQVTISVLLIC